jgi:hypothetical protein
MFSKPWCHVVFALMLSKCFLTIASTRLFAWFPELGGLIWVGWMDQIPIQGEGLPVLILD